MLKKECCGKEFSQEDQVCSECGKELVEKNACVICGAELNNEFEKTCPICGGSQEEATEDANQPTEDGDGSILLPEFNDGVVSDLMVEEKPKKKSNLILILWASVASAAAIALAVLFIVLPMLSSSVVGKWFVSTSTGNATAYIEFKNKDTFSFANGQGSTSAGKYKIGQKGNAKTISLIFDANKTSPENGEYFINGNYMYLTVADQTIRFVKVNK